VWFPSVGNAATGLLASWFDYQLFAEFALAEVLLPSVLPLIVSVSTFLAVGAWFMVWSGTKLTHRIAGPAVKLLEAVRRMRAGDLDFEIRLRQSDELQELATELELLKAEMRAGLRGSATSTAGAGLSVDDVPSPLSATELADEAVGAEHEAAGRR
jgi:methyl-accepting chemotaxis protein